MGIGMIYIRVENRSNFLGQMVFTPQKALCPYQMSL